jgi:Glycosyl hydrolase family 81 N-terminal domain
MPAPEPLGSRPRPQYHYFYGSLGSTEGRGEDAVTRGESSAEQEHESLIGEELVPTDHELDTPNGSEQDLQHMVITNGRHKKRTSDASSKPWFVFGAASQSVGSTLSKNNALGRFIGIILLTILMSALLIIWFPHTAPPLTSSQAIYIPFPSVDRGEYGDPVEGFINVNLFHPTLLSDTQSRTFVFAFPTGAFWTNLVVPPPTEALSYPVVVYPYAYKWSDTVLQLSYPSAHRLVTENSIQDPFAPDLTFSTQEEITERYVIKFDPLSVTLRFSADAQTKWESVLVQGSPYVTLKYLSATPVIRALSIFKSVECPGDDDENFTDMFDDGDTGGGDSNINSRRRRLFGVCSIDVSTITTVWRPCMCVCM